MITAARDASASRQIPRESNDRIEDDGDGQRQHDRARTLRQPVARFVQADLVDPSGRPDRRLDRARLSLSIGRASLPARHRSIRIPTGIRCSYPSDDDGCSRSDRRAGPSAVRADRRSGCGGAGRPDRDRRGPDRARQRRGVPGAVDRATRGSERRAADPRAGARTSIDARPSARGTDGRDPRPRHVGRHQPDHRPRDASPVSGRRRGPGGPTRDRRGAGPASRPMSRPCSRPRTSTTTATWPDTATRPTS